MKKQKRGPRLITTTKAAILDRNRYGVAERMKPLLNVADNQQHNALSVTISNREPNARTRILQHFLANLGRMISNTEIEQISGIKNWHQRISELRVDQGYEILSDRDRQSIPKGYYLMESEKTIPTLSKRVRVAPSPQCWSKVLARANNQCEHAHCTLREGDRDPKGRGTVHLVADHKTPHACSGNETDINNPEDWQVLCPRHNVEKSNFRDDKTGRHNVLELLKASSNQVKQQCFGWLSDWAKKSTTPSVSGACVEIVSSSRPQNQLALSKDDNNNISQNIGFAGAGGVSNRQALLLLPIQLTTTSSCSDTLPVIVNNKNIDDHIHQFAPSSTLRLQTTTMTTSKTVICTTEVTSPTSPSMHQTTTNRTTNIGTVIGNGQGQNQHVSTRKKKCSDKRSLLDNDPKICKQDWNRVTAAKRKTRSYESSAGAANMPRKSSSANKRNKTQTMEHLLV